MECTIGWIKTESGFIMFKNRDRDKEENINSNFMLKNNKIITFEDKVFNGCWFGFNGNFGINSAYGPYRGFTDKNDIKNENFEINKIVLQKTKSVDEATSLYKKLFLEGKIDKSFNVIISDSNKANILELVKDMVNIEIVNDSVLRTNSFLHLKEYNNDSKKVGRSQQRLKKALDLVKNVKKAQDVVPILKSHSNNEIENICRHDYALTVGSTILELKDNEIIIYYLLNKSPCQGEYEKEIIPLITQKL